MEMRSESTAKIARFLIVAFILGYAICPDLLPGPIDDIIVMLVGVAFQKRITVAGEEY